MRRKGETATTITTRTNNVGRVAIMQDTKLSNDLLSNLWLDIQPNQFSCQLYTRLFMPYRLQMIVKGKRNKKRGRGLSEWVRGGDTASIMSNSPYAQLQIKDHGVYQARAGGRRPGGQEKGRKDKDGWKDGLRWKAEIYQSILTKTSPPAPRPRPLICSKLSVFTCSRSSRDPFFFKNSA